MNKLLLITILLVGIILPTTAQAKRIPVKNNKGQVTSYYDYNSKTGTVRTYKKNGNYTGKYVTTGKEIRKYNSKGQLQERIKK